MVSVSREHIEIVEGASGPKVRIAGSRIRVLDVVIWHDQMGMSPEEIVEEFPTITLGDVYAALAYYWDHRNDIQAAIAREHEIAEKYRKIYPSRAQEKLKRPQGE
ncbi:MAG: DUF433 domain-containing protein [Thermomicrobiales bacterium]